MSDFVRFTKQGLVAFDWDGDKQEYVPDTDPHPHGNIVNLRSRCEIEDGVTLLEIFRAVDDDPLLMDFIGCYSWCSAIKEFHDQALLPPPEPKEGDVKMVALEVQAYGEFHRSYKDKHGPPVFNGIWWDFTGLGSDGINYSVSYSPMNELADVPVRIKPCITFTKDHLPEEMLPPATITISLLEFLDAIYFDISFHGGPKENKEFLEKLHGMVTEIEEGKATLVPFNFHDEEDDEDDDEDLTDSSPDLQK